MGDSIVEFQMINAPPRQRINHAHIEESIVRLHWHPPEKEPSEPAGVIFSKEDFLKMMTTNYWKKEESLEASGAPGTNLISADVHIGHVLFQFKKGNRTSKEEVSALSLRQVDSRVRRRVRDVRESES